MLVFPRCNTHEYKPPRLNKDALLPEEMGTIEAPANMFDVSFFIHQDYIGLLLIFTHLAPVSLQKQDK